MSILGDLDDLILRETSNPPLTTKGAELTYAEMDTRIIGFYDAVQSIVSGVNVTAYDAGHTYDQYDPDIRNRYASYGVRIWKATYAGSPSSFSGQTPAEGVYWTQVTLAEMLPNILELARLAEGLTANDPAQIYHARLDIASADVLTSNASPVPFGLTVPTGYAVKVLALDGTLDFGTTPYATNGSVLVRCVGTTDPQAGWTANQFLFGTVTRSVTATLTSSTGVTSDQLIEGADVETYVSTGNPTAGDSDITLYLTYILIEI